MYAMPEKNHAIQINVDLPIEKEKEKKGREDITSS